jgi:hypothetical protein
MPASLTFEAIFRIFGLTHDLSEKGTDVGSAVRLRNRGSTDRYRALMQTENSVFLHDPFRPAGEDDDARAGTFSLRYRRHPATAAWVPHLVSQ